MSNVNHLIELCDGAADGVLLVDNNWQETYPVDCALALDVRSVNEWANEHVMHVLATVEEYKEYLFVADGRPVQIQVHFMVEAEDYTYRSVCTTTWAVYQGQVTSIATSFRHNI